MKKDKNNYTHAHVVAVDMGYGHLRAAYNLNGLAGGKIYSVNRYHGIPHRDKQIWDQSRKFYEFISKFKNVPIIGNKVFSYFDKFQRVENFYPVRDMTKPTLQLAKTLQLIRRKKWGKHFIDKLNKDPKPLISTFFVTAYMAEEFGYKNDIYLVVCDADVSRAWAIDKANVSRIKYFVPTERVRTRLKMYGVREENIYLTGFPMPKENTGSKRLTILKKDLGIRLANLDPTGKYIKTYERTLHKYLDGYVRHTSTRPLTIMFVVGGAGAQREIGVCIVKALHKKITENKVKIILVAGIHNDVSKYFREEIIKLGLRNEIGKGINIIYAPNKPAYFEVFNQALHHTDIIWTKPSELSFYTSLGLPFILTEPIGSQEFCNRNWLEKIGSSLRQKPIEHTAEWLFELVDSGWLAEAAMEGFLEAPNLGTYNIEEIVQKNYNR